MKWEADTSARSSRGGGFACEIFENDGSQDGGRPLATAYGETADEAAIRGAAIADAMNGASI